MLFRLFLLFTLVPFIELMLLIKLSELHGWPTTLALILVTGVVGTMLVRRQGLLIAQRIRQEMSQGKPPTDALMDGAMILVSGALLITPGILTDVFGFLLLWPLFRKLIKKSVRSSLMKNSKVTFHQQVPGQGFTPFDSPFTNPASSEAPPRVDDAGNDVIDVEFEKRDQ
ncbi:MAG: FxsA family protein [Planctomycetaceae bacterium]|nr:FxsA family protein [Planctomycetaceae bacterium]